MKVDTVSSNGIKPIGDYKMLFCTEIGGKSLSKTAQTFIKNGINVSRFPGIPTIFRRIGAYYCHGAIIHSAD